LSTATINIDFDKLTKFWYRLTKYRLGATPTERLLELKVLIWIFILSTKMSIVV